MISEHLEKQKVILRDQPGLWGITWESLGFLLFLLVYPDRLNTSKCEKWLGQRSHNFRSLLLVQVINTHELSGPVHYQMEQ